MTKTMKAVGAALMLATSAAAMTPVYAQPASPDRGDHRGDRDRGDRGGRDWDRGDRGDRGGRGDHDRRGDDGYRGGHRGGHDHGGAIVGGVVGGILGGLLHGENYNYRFRYDNDYDYYARRGYGRGHYDSWRGRNRGYGGCNIIGYSSRHGCRTIYVSPEFIILNLRGDVFCYRRGYRAWRNTYCPRNWYDY